jgi:hypothetical protein
MATLFEGNCIGKAVSVEFGADSQGKPRVRWEMEVIDGPHTGKRARYSGKLDEENIKWTKRDMVAIGWKGKDVRTFVDDAKTANATVPFEAQIAEWNGNQWTAAKMAGGAKPLAALDRDKVDNVNEWFAKAGDVGGSNSDIPF